MIGTADSIGMEIMRITCRPTSISKEEVFGLEQTQKQISELKRSIKASAAISILEADRNARQMIKSSHSANKKRLDEEIARLVSKQTSEATATVLAALNETMNVVEMLRGRIVLLELKQQKAALDYANRLGNIRPPG